MGGELYEMEVVVAVAAGMAGLEPFTSVVIDQKLPTIRQIIRQFAKPHFTALPRPPRARQNLSNKHNPLKLLQPQKPQPHNLPNKFLASPPLETNLGQTAP